LTIRRIIEVITGRCGWVQNSRLTNPSQKRWVFKHSSKPYPITLTGDMNRILRPHEEGGILRSACDDWPTN
jgi:hypothetical protein